MSIHFYFAVSRNDGLVLPHGKPKERTVSMADSYCTYICSMCVKGRKWIWKERLSLTLLPQPLPANHPSAMVSVGCGKATFSSKSVSLMDRFVPG